MADYDSNFESDVETNKRAKRDHELVIDAPSTSKRARTSAKSDFNLEHGLEEKRRQRKCFLNLDAYTRHKMLVNEYRLCYPGATAQLARDTSNDKTDVDILRENHKFLWDEGDETESWGKRLAKKYYDALFKEYGICDLSRYKENKIAMRWRTDAEVVSGKGQFVCGEKRCSSSKRLRSWEVNFGYLEEGTKKNALVKMRLCPDCSYMLNYNHKKREAKRRREKDNEHHEKEKCSERAHSSKADTEADVDIDDCLDNLLL